MKRKTAALYDPYLDTIGGGEKHILQILQVLADDGYEINIFWDKNITAQLFKKFSLQLFKKLKYLPYIFRDNGAFHSFKTFETLKHFDYFFYVTDGSYFFSGAKKNFVFCMVPRKNLYPNNIIDKLKTWNYRFISNSRYTQKWLGKWGIKSDYIYPYINNELIDDPSPNKEKIILSVGRFFPQLHSKQHEKIIAVFNKMQRSHQNFKDYKLILAGGLKDEDKDYFRQIKNLTQKNPSIILKPDISLDELYELYKLATFFWHFTGYGVDEKAHPELVEHLGITPLEAMAAGAITFCYNAGGPKEIVTDGQNGYLFNNENELQTKMMAVLEDQNKQKTIRDNANNFIRQNFSYEVFKQRVNELILCHAGTKR